MRPGKTNPPAPALAVPAGRLRRRGPRCQTRPAIPSRCRAEVAAHLKNGISLSNLDSNEPTVASRSRSEAADKAGGEDAGCAPCRVPASPAHPRLYAHPRCSPTRCRTSDCLCRWSPTEHGRPLKPPPPCMIERVQWTLLLCPWDSNCPVCTFCCVFLLSTSAL